MSLAQNIDLLAAAVRGKFNAIAGRLLLPGGAQGQLLGKASAADFDYAWLNPGGGSAGAPIELLDQGGVPATPGSGLLKLYARSRARRMFLDAVGPSGVDFTLQPAFFNSRVMIIAPSSGTTVSAQGIGVTTAATLSHPGLVTTSLVGSIYRTRCQTSTTAGNAAGIRHAAATIWRGNAAGRGGFYHHVRFASGNIALAGGQQFIGLSSSTAALAGEPSALADCLGVVKDQADTQYHFVRRTGTGTVQRVALGAFGANALMDLILFMPPNSSTLGAVVRAFDTNGIASTLLDTTYTDFLPANTTYLAGRFDVRNGASAAAADADLVRMYTESDF
mgnify:CR=1 FL=1